MITWRDISYCGIALTVLFLLLAFISAENLSWAFIKTFWTLPFAALICYPFFYCIGKKDRPIGLIPKILIAMTFALLCFVLIKTILENAKIYK